MILDRVLRAFPGYSSLPLVDGPRVIVPSKDYQAWLDSNNGATGFSGALRLFSRARVSRLADISSWNSNDGWKGAYGALAPDQLIFFAEDAFGVQFGFDQRGDVVRFWPETAEQEPLGLGVGEFFEAIAADPDGTISTGLFDEAVERYELLLADQHWAFLVETALGGLASLENLGRLDALLHMTALGKIALQIAAAPIGSRFTARAEE